MEQRKCRPSCVFADNNYKYSTFFHYSQTLPNSIKKLIPKKNGNPRPVEYAKSGRFCNRKNCIHLGEWKGGSGTRIKGVFKPECCLVHPRRVWSSLDWCLAWVKVTKLSIESFKDQTGGRVVRTSDTKEIIQLAGRMPIGCPIASPGLRGIISSDSVVTVNQINIFLFNRNKR